MLPTFDQRFRAINDWAVSNGYKAGFPTCHSANYNDGRGRVYGNILLPAHVVDWRDVFASEQGNPQNLRERLTGAHDYAVRNGYLHGYPNFHQANYGQGVVYGTFLIKKNPNPPVTYEPIAQWRDVPATDLGITGDPKAVPLETWFTRAHDYAARSGWFVAGMPNGHTANHGHGWVIGVFLFRPGPGYAEFRDIPARELGLPDDAPSHEPFTVVMHHKGGNNYSTAINFDHGQIVALTNTSGVKLSFTHTDARGTTTSPQIFEANTRKTSVYAGRTVRGTWKAIRMSSGTSTPASLSMRVEWRP